MTELENTQSVRKVSDTKAEYSEICLPNDTNMLGNMLGGHIVMKVFAGFVVTGLTLGGLGALIGILSMGTIVALTTLEFLVAYLQAFVFAVLACVYLSDVVNIGHH